MNDEPSWTVRKGQPEASWTDWLFAHAVLLAVGLVIGGVVGWIWPLILATDPFPNVVERDTLLDSPSGDDWRERELRREAGRAEDEVRDAIQREGVRQVRDGTNEQARVRAVIGGLVGLVLAGVVAWASRRRRAVPS